MALMTDLLGYSIHSRVFTREEMSHLANALDTASLSRTRAGARHVLGVAAARAIAEDQRMVSLARHYLGDTVTPFRATLFDKSRASNWLVAWHQDLALPIVRRTDDPAWGPWSTKGGLLYAIAPASALERIIALRVHLDPSTATNGPLRVLPGTHVRGVLEDSEVQGMAAIVTPVDCVCPAGGVVALRPLTVHASSKAAGAVPRRVLHIEYASSLALGPDIRLALA